MLCFQGLADKGDRATPSTQTLGGGLDDTHVDPSNTWDLTSDTGAQGFLKTLLLVLC